jgi:muscleblind
VCSDFQHGQCLYSAETCPFAHPQAHCPLDADGLVTVCVDYVKGKCLRETCKYFHPPEHLVAQLKAVKAQTTAAAASAQVFSTTAATIQYSPSTIQLVHPLTLNSSQSMLTGSSTTAYAYSQHVSTTPACSSSLVCLNTPCTLACLLVCLLAFNHACY